MYTDGNLFSELTQCGWCSAALACDTVSPDDSSPPPTLVSWIGDGVQVP